MATLICLDHPDLQQPPGSFCIDPLCGRPLTPAPPRPAAPAPEMCSIHGCGMPLTDGRCPLHPAGAAATTVQQRPLTPYTADAAAHLAGSPPPGTYSNGVAQLVLPWARVELVANPMILGRDFSEIWGNQIKQFDNVSRRHAEFSHRGGQLYVRDVKSTNGVTINNRPIKIDEPILLSDGDVIGFGADLEATVRLTQGDPR